MDKIKNLEDEIFETYYNEVENEKNPIKAMKIIKQKIAPRLKLRRELLEQQTKVLPRCYNECNPKDFGKRGEKFCMGEYLMTDVPAPLADRCKNCKYYGQLKI